MNQHPQSIPALPELNPRPLLHAEPLFPTPQSASKPLDRRTYYVNSPIYLFVSIYFMYATEAFPLFSISICPPFTRLSYQSRNILHLTNAPRHPTHANRLHSLLLSLPLTLSIPLCPLPLTLPIYSVSPFPTLATPFVPSRPSRLPTNFLSLLPFPLTSLPRHLTNPSPRPPSSLIPPTLSPPKAPPT